MGRPSKFDRLPPEIRDTVFRLRDNGRTIDEIMAALHAMEVTPDALPSRSGLGVEVQSIDRVLEMTRQTRATADVLARESAEAPEGRQARANIELTQASIMQVLIGAASGGVKLDARDAGYIAKALSDLTRAARTDLETRRLIKAELAAEMETKLAELGTEVETAKAPPTPAEMLARIRALYAGEG
jgi:hypothetical protein